MKNYIKGIVLLTIFAHVSNYTMDAPPAHPLCYFNNLSRDVKELIVLCHWRCQRFEIEKLNKGLGAVETVCCGTVSHIHEYDCQNLYQKACKSTADKKNELKKSLTVAKSCLSALACVNKDCNQIHFGLQFKNLQSIASMAEANNIEGIENSLNSFAPPIIFPRDDCSAVILCCNKVFWRDLPIIKDALKAKGMFVGRKEWDSKIFSAVCLNNLMCAILCHEKDEKKGSRENKKCFADILCGEYSEDIFDKLNVPVEKSPMDEFIGERQKSKDMENRPLLTFYAQLRDASQFLNFLISKNLNGHATYLQKRVILNNHLLLLDIDSTFLPKSLRNGVYVPMPR